MEFRYSALIVPSNTKPDNIQDSRKFSLTSTDRYDKNDRVYKLKRKMTEDGFINSFALRNYWTFALGETKIIDTSWKSTKDLVSKIDQIDGVDYTKKKEDFATESVVLRSDKDQMGKVKKEIQSRFGNKLPIYQGYECYEIIISTKWLSPNSRFFFDDVSHLW